MCTTISSWSQDDYNAAKEVEACAATDKSSPEDLLSPIVTNGEAHQALDGDISGRNFGGLGRTSTFELYGAVPAK